MVFQIHAATMSVFLVAMAAAAAAAVLLWLLPPLLLLHTSFSRATQDVICHILEKPFHFLQHVASEN